MKTLIRFAKRNPAKVALIVAAVLFPFAPAASVTVVLISPLLALCGEARV